MSRIVSIPISISISPSQLDSDITEHINSRVHHILNNAITDAGIINNIIKIHNFTSGKIDTDTGNTIYNINVIVNITSPPKVGDSVLATVCLVTRGGYFLNFNTFEIFVLEDDCDDIVLNSQVNVQITSVRYDISHKNKFIICGKPAKIINKKVKKRSKGK